MNKMNALKSILRSLPTRSKLNSVLSKVKNLTHRQLCFCSAFNLTPAQKFFHDSKFLIWSLRIFFRISRILRIREMRKKSHEMAKKANFFSHLMRFYNIKKNCQQRFYLQILFRQSAVEFFWLKKFALISKIFDKEMKK